MADKPKSETPKDLKNKPKPGDVSDQDVRDIVDRTRDQYGTKK